MNKEVEDNITKEAIIEQFESIDGDHKTAELIIRKGEALPALVPTKVTIVGNIDSPVQYLSKRVMELDQKKCHVLVNREQLEVTLVLNEDCPYTQGKIAGKITPHPMFVKFGINSGRYITTFEMAELIKMNRSAFENRQEAMDLVSQLKNFKAKVEKDLEKADDSRGNRKVLLHQTVESNVPEKFNLHIPIFKGLLPETIEAEIYFNPDDLTCTLVSPQANDILEEVRDNSIDGVIGDIFGIAPQIVIIEQ